jgi:hypothetical protein
MTYKRKYWMAVLLAALSFTNARAATISWTNTAGGLWGLAANWDPNIVPRSFDSAAITANGTYTITIDTNVNVASLTLGAASGAQTLTNFNQNMTITNALVSGNGTLVFSGGTLTGTSLTNYGTFNWRGGNVAMGVTVGATGVLNVNAGSVSLLSPLTNAGTIHWIGSPASISIANNHGIYTGFIYNQAGALFDIQNDQGIYCACYGFESFVNAGTVRKSSGLGVTSFGVAFTNTGLIDAQSGTIQFSAGGNIGGTYNTASGATIQFVSGNYIETGTVTNSGSGLFRLYGANVTLNDRITKFLLVSGNVALSPTFQGSGTIQNLQLDGAYLTGTNRVTGTLGFNGGGMASASPLTVTASGVLNFNGVGVNIYAPLTNAGTINWSGAGVSLANNLGIYTGSIYNQPGGILNLQNDQNCSSAGYGSEFFNNAGTVRKSAGLGVSTFSLPFTNSGAIDAQSGTIQFTGSGNLGGTYNTASDAIIQFAGGNYLHNGPVTVTGSGLCRQNGANVTLYDKITNFLLVAGNVGLTPSFQGSGAITNLQLDGAYLIGTNRVTGTLGFNGGGIGSASPLTVATNGALNFNVAQVNIYSPLTNAGTINWSGGSVSVANNLGIYTGAIYNQPGALFKLQSDSVVSSAGYGSEFFVNAGTIRKTAGLGVSSFSLPVTNTGAMDAQSGTIQFNSGGTIGGTYNTASGATIQFAAGTYLHTGAVAVTGSGLSRLYGATVTLNDKIANFILASGTVQLSPIFQLDGTIHNLQLDGAYLAGTNRVTGTLGFNGGGLASASPLTITANGVLNFNGAAVNIYAPLTNSGTINWLNGSLSVANNAGVYTGTINNQGIWNLQCDQGLSSAGYGFENFSNIGTLRKTAGLGTTTISLAFANNGTLDAQAGTIRIAGPYTQTGGTMNFGITSLAYFGQIAFSAGAPLTGTVSANFNGGYFPSAGDTFPLMTFASHPSIFANTAFPPQATWQTNYTATSFTLSVLTVTAGGTPVTLTPVSFASGKFTLRLNGDVGPQYILQASTNLFNWTGIFTNTPAVMPVTIIDTNAGVFPRRFYRALVGP